MHRLLSEHRWIPLTFIGTDGKVIWATGGWSATIKGENFGSTRVKGYWSAIREGDD
jgi:hypothetical protein